MRSHKITFGKPSVCVIDRSGDGVGFRPDGQALGHQRGHRPAGRVFQPRGHGFLGGNGYGGRRIVRGVVGPVRGPVVGAVVPNLVWNDDHPGNPGEVVESVDDERRAAGPDHNAGSALFDDGSVVAHRAALKMALITRGLERSCRRRRPLLSLVIDPSLSLAGVSFGLCLRLRLQGP